MSILNLSWIFAQLHKRVYVWGLFLNGKTLESVSSFQKKSETLATTQACFS